MRRLREREFSQRIETSPGGPVASPDVELIRFASTPFGTFGRLSLLEFGCYTVERPWRGNRPLVSCIPVGDYTLRPTRFNRGGYDTYEVVNVPGRSLIKIHVGNTQDAVEGCIAVGLGLGVVRGQWAVTNSRTAFRRFMVAMGKVAQDARAGFPRFRIRLIQTEDESP